VTGTRFRLTILAVFGGSLLLQVIAIYVVRGHMWPEELPQAIARLMSLYSIHLAVVLGGIFARSRERLPRVSSALAWTAIALVALWNAMLVARTISFAVADADSIGDLLKYWDIVGSSSSFLVVGVLAFVFTRPGSEAPASSPSAKREKKRAANVEAH
jgi:hypothetical protein